MKTLVGSVSLLALVQLVTAQRACLSLTTLFPDCAFPCVTSAGSAVGCTVATDLACRCNPASSSAIQNAAALCVINACTRPGELASALGAGPSICGCHRTAVPDPTTTSEAPEETTTTSEEPGETTTTSEAPGETTTSEAPEETSTTEAPGDTSTEETTGEATTSEETTADPETTATTDITITLDPITTTTAPPGSCDSETPCQASVDAVPKCAEGCLSSAAVTNANCAFDDYECQCSSTAVIQEAAQGCVIGDCGIGDAIKVLDAVGDLCDCVEANPTTPCETTTTETDAGTTSDETETTAPPPDTETETTAPPPDTETETDPQEPTCTAGTTEDCAPVASTAIPECAQQCFTSAAPGVGCDVEDFACQCEQEAQESLSQLLVPCVVTACPGESLTAVITGAASVCACATAEPSGDCPTTDDGPGSGTKTKPTATQKPPTTETDGPTTTCEEAAAVTPDCGPVATSAVPECAQACFSSAAPEVGCDVHDYACQCEEEALGSLSQLLVPCVATACPGASLTAVITGASSVCACAHAAPTAGGCATGGGGSGGGPGKPTAKPTKTGGHGGGGGGAETTCKAGTTSDCGPVASSVIPSCAQACFTSAAPKVGCDVHDYACQCEEEALGSLSQLLVPCVATACEADQLQGVITGASSVCACATAAPEGGDCDEPGKPGHSEKPPKPTGGHGGGGGGDDGKGTTCVPGPVTEADCGPVASSVIPSCAHACFSSAAPGVGCDVTDYACQCEAEALESLSQLLIPCVATACDSGDIPAVITGASQVCQCAHAEPTGGDDCDSDDGDGDGGHDHSTETTCVTVTKSEAGEVTKTSSCYCVKDGHTLTKIPGPTAAGEEDGGSDGSGGGSGGDKGDEGGDGGSGGDKGDGSEGGKGEEEDEGEPAVVVGNAARYEIGLVAGVFGAFWLVAIAL